VTLPLAAASGQRQIAHHRRWRDNHWMDVFKTLRLRATRLSHEDLPDLVQLHLDEEVSRFLGGIRSPEATAAYLKVSLRHWNQHGFGLWALRTEDGAFVGRAGLRRIEIEDTPELEVAYTLARTSWGSGYATEVTRALVEVWRHRRLGPTLVGVVMKGHQRSEHVLLKSGFAYERDAIFHGETCGIFRCRH
jgi:RimJ/RimL family protein N-acetyltransferase